MDKIMNFPTNFRWGTATAAFQIEGAASEDGRGQSIWDDFCRKPGAVMNGDTGDIACDHYHRWKEDIKLIKELGIPNYRFSIAWPRILPKGSGKVNQPGIDFYNRIIDQLLDSGIHPLVTLYHWDLPSALTDAWLNRGVVDAFADYTQIVARAFGDRVKNWVTINEPWCASFLSYKLGIHAPGMHDLYKAFVAAHHLLLAHGKVVPILRSECKDAHVGIALNLSPFYPFTDSPADCEAARYGDGELARWFLDPLYGRKYPTDIIADMQKAGIFKSSTPEFIHPGDFEIIAAPMDYVALNYYSRNVVKANPNHSEDPSRFEFGSNPSVPRTDIGWEVYPPGLYEVIARVHNDYRPQEIIISENGASYADGPDSDGSVHDQRRIDYLDAHIRQVGKAIEAGIPVSGYYLWSLMDNFEWSMGYSQRFGIIHVDYETQKRTIKDSAFWYSELIKRNSI
jgi:beta-glucosidase